MLLASQTYTAALTLHIRPNPRSAPPFPHPRTHTHMPPPPQDLERMPGEEVARICEWLTEKVDALSTRLKAEPKEEVRTATILRPSCPSPLARLLCC